MAVAPELIGAGATAAGTAAALGAGAGATAAGAGLGAGLGGGTAALFGAGTGALAPSTLGLLGGGAAMGSAAAPAAAAGMGGGTAALFGAGTAGASPLATQLAMTTPAAGGMNMNALQTMMKGAAQGMGQPQRQPAPAAQPRGMTGDIQSNADILKRLQLQAMMGPRSDFAGLLGRFQ